MVIFGRRDIISQLNRNNRMDQLYEKPFELNFISVI